MIARFGPAGNSASFTAMGYKSSLQVPEYLKKFGLNAFEYQCGRGVRISKDLATEFGKLAALEDIALSIHAPYYISMSSVEEEKRDKSINYILQSAEAVTNMGGSRVVFHPGACSKITREHALELAIGTLKNTVNALDNNGYSHITLCPETMGKIAQLGTLEEVMELCLVDDRIIPCIDFGHLNARTGGGLKTYEDFQKIFTTMENKIGLDRLRVFHAHFSKIEYTAGGEKRHLTFDDKVYGPEFDFLAELIHKYSCTPTIICESDGTQSEDALTMMNMYKGLAK